MGLKGIKPISLIWVTISLITFSTCKNIPKIQNLDCLNDFKEKMFCFWETIGSSSNCSEDFVVRSEDSLGKKETCRDLRNEQFDGSAVANKCICDIAISHFTYGNVYKIEVESYGQPVGNTTIEIAFTIKPIAPSNVRIEFIEEWNGLVQWDTGYMNNFINTKLSFHVQILSKHDRNVVKEDFLEQLEPQYTFNKRQLKRGEDYLLRIRTMPAKNLGFKGPWSEWSQEAEWANDYSPSLTEFKNILIPITCLLMVFLIIASYVCCTRYKKKWWNNIPNPAKSKLVQSTLLQRQSLNPDGKSAAKTTCGRFFSRIVKSHASKCNQLTQQHDAKDYVNVIESYDYKKVVFQPEDEDIERCVKMYPTKENEISVQGDKMEYKSEDLLLEGDPSIAKMFFDILCDSSGIKVDTCEDLNPLSSFGGSGWMEGFVKKGTQRCDSNVSAYRESGYNSYGSDESPLDCLSDIDRLNTSYFDRWHDDEKDSIPYTPQVKENVMYRKEEYPLESLRYNRFADALAGARKDFIIDASKTFCVDSLSNHTVLCKCNSHKRFLAPKSILYYNTKYLFSPKEDSFQLIIKPNPQQVSEITLQSCESTFSSTSDCHGSGYQSFDQAVQDNDPRYGCKVSEYKSFDQAVHEGGPDSGCQVSGYQSFDQAVQQGDVTTVCQVNGYQSFHQAVQEDDTSQSTNCSVVDSGYKPLEDFILQNSEYSAKDISENNRQYKLEESHSQNNTESLHREKFTDVTENGNNKNGSKSPKYELLSSELMRFWLEDFVNSKEKYHPSKDISDTSFKGLKIAVDTILENDLVATHKRSPLALTFDICEHLRNLENTYGHNVPLNSLIFASHLDEVHFVHEQLSSNKYLTSQKCPPTESDTFENLSYFVPLCDLENLGSSQQTKHLLMNQVNADIEGNSYMKLALP